MSDAAESLQFLTTREVADLLRVKERKVYDLASAGDIPCRRVTGKLLFPKAEIEAWISGAATPSAPAATEAVAPAPCVVAGSHDPLLEWALRESGSGLATFFDGSLDGLERLRAREAAVCGVHIFEPQSGNWNVDRVADALAGRPFVLVEWAMRRQGLILAPQQTGTIKGVADLRGARVVVRQPSAGGRILFEHLLTDAGLTLDDLTVCPSTARTETEVAALLASGDADAALGLEAMARQFRLGFVPLTRERYDLVIDRRAYFDPPVQKLMAFCHEAAFRDKAEAMGGYEVSGLGTVHWNAHCP